MSKIEAGQKTICAVVGTDAPDAAAVFKDGKSFVPYVDELYAVAKARKALEERETLLKVLFSANFKATGVDEYMGKQGKVTVTPKTNSTISARALYKLLTEKKQQPSFWGLVKVGMTDTKKLLSPEDYGMLVEKTEGSPAVSVR